MIPKTITLALTEYNSLLESVKIAEQSLSDANLEIGKLTAQIPTLGRIYIPAQSHNIFSRFADQNVIVMVDLSKKESLKNIVEPYIERNERWLKESREEWMLHEKQVEANKVIVQEIRVRREEIDNILNKYPKWLMELLGLK